MTTRAPWLAVAGSIIVAAPTARAEEALPAPPSVEPKVYAAWLKAQPKKDQRRIARFCRARPTDFEATCGGIGPLHVPYPPYPRAQVKAPGGVAHGPPGPESLFASTDAWWASLSAGQRGYVRQHCAHAADRWESSDLCGDFTPLVLSFGGAAVEYQAGGAFAFAPGAPVATDWPTAATPWLALDRDGDGAITSGAELFGDRTLLPDGARALHGFAALAVLDGDHDGVIDAADPAFTRLLLWRDADGDHRSSAGELSPLAAEVASISLAYTLAPRCDLRGNCEGERSTFTRRDGTNTGAVVDVYLPRR